MGKSRGLAMAKTAAEVNLNSALLESAAHFRHARRVAC